MINHFNPLNYDTVRNILPSSNFLNFFNINIINFISLGIRTLKFYFYPTGTDAKANIMNQNVEPVRSCLFPGP